MQGNVPHVACNVWLRGNDTYHYGIYNENKHPTHTLQATCGTLLTSENELLTHTLQARCGTFALLLNIADNKTKRAALLRGPYFIELLRNYFTTFLPPMI